MASRDPRRLRVWLFVAAVAAAAAGPLAQPQPGPRPQAVSPFPRGLTGTLAFESDAGGRPAIYTLNLQTGAGAPLAGNAASTSQTPRWSPDGRRLVFTSNRVHYEGPRPEQGTPDLDLWVVNADGSGLERLTTDPANEVDPAWTPDGTAVVFSSDRESRGDLYQLTLATKSVTRLTRHFVGRAIMPAPAAAPARVAFAAQTLRVGAFWDYQIHVRQADGATTPVASPAGACWPRWSPDGRRMAHVRLNPNAPSTLELRSGPGLQSTGVLTTPGLWSYYPAWSPDQSHLVYSVSPEHHEGEDWDLAVIEVATGKWQRLTQGRGNDRLPDWKP